MTPLESLRNRGYCVRLTPRQDLNITPVPPDNLLAKIAAKKDQIIQQILREHQTQMIRQAKELEDRILALLNSGRISQEEAENKLHYVFKLTATTPAPTPPCHCGEVLLWCHTDELPATPDLPLLCAACFPPGSSDVTYFIADENANTQEESPETPVLAESRQ